MIHARSLIFLGWHECPFIYIYIYSYYSGEIRDHVFSPGICAANVGTSATPSSPLSVVDDNGCNGPTSAALAAATAVAAGEDGGCVLGANRLHFGRLV